MPQLDPGQEVPAAVLEDGTPVVRLVLTKAGDSPEWRAVYNEIAAANGTPAHIENGPNGDPILVVYLTDTSTSRGVADTLEIASGPRLWLANTAGAQPPANLTPHASKTHGGGALTEVADADLKVNQWWVRRQSAQS